MPNNANTRIDFGAFPAADKTCVKTDSGNIRTPLCRLTFANLFVARAPKNDPGKEAKFSTGVLIPPGTDLSLLAKMAEDTARAKWGDKTPGKLKSPFLKAGEYEYDGYAEGWTLIRASSKQKPGIVGPDAQAVDDERQVYPGRWAFVTLSAFAYENSGNRGVSFGLRNVQLVHHDNPLGGGAARAEDEFKPVEGASGPASSMFGGGAEPAKAPASSMFG